MHLQRVQVPDFRVLKDIDITFEKDFFPRIFPLGSLNGGGKSTLLQLIFILLHCSADETKHEFIRNLLEGFEISEDSDKRVLARFEIWDGEKIVNLEFFMCTQNYIVNLLKENYWQNTDLKSYTISSIKSRIKSSEKRKQEITKIIKALEQLDSNNLTEKVNAISLLGSLGSLGSFELNEKHKRSNELKTVKNEIDLLKNQLQKIDACLFSNSLVYILDLEIYNNKQVFLYRIQGIDIDKSDVFLEKISKQIFLVIPPTQICLFIPKKHQKSLFKLPKESLEEETYFSELNKAKKKLSHYFFSENFFALDTVINLLANSYREKDDEQVERTGEYGKNYPLLVQSLNQLLVDKKIKLNRDLTGVSFTAENNGEEVELYPEDLSHGELKRLSLYVWLKYSNIENAIILFDEIEIALHPDWQYQIVRDLEEWGPTNQYILATHSYELCQALTPVHVKEIEPKLLNQAKK